MVELVRATGLFVVTALMELTGSYLMYLWLRQGRSAWLGGLAALCLVGFGYLLTLHPGAAARTYAAYGGVYVAAALGWLVLVERQTLVVWDALGVGIILVGVAVIILARG